MLAGLLLAAVIGLVALNLRASGRNDAAIRSATDLSDRIETVLSAMKDLETGERGFLLTGNDEFLQPYNEALANLAMELSPVAGPTDDLPELRKLVNAKRDVAGAGHSRQAFRRAAGGSCAGGFRCRQGDDGCRARARRNPARPAAQAGNQARKAPAYPRHGRDDRFVPDQPACLPVVRLACDHAAKARARNRRASARRSGKRARGAGVLRLRPARPSRQQGDPGDGRHAGRFRPFSDRPAGLGCAASAARGVGRSSCQRPQAGMEHAGHRSRAALSRRLRRSIQIPACNRLSPEVFARPVKTKDRDTAAEGRASPERTAGCRAGADGYHRAQAVGGSHRGCP